MVILNVTMFFCKHVKNILHPKKKGKLEKNFDFVVYDNAEEVDPEEWDSVLNHSNVFLELDYLKILDKTPTGNFQSRYVIIYNKNAPFAIAYFQVIDFKSSVFGDIMDSQVNQLKSHKARLFEHYLDKNKDEVVMRLLTCGNNVVSGEHAFLFKEKLSVTHQFKIIEELIDKMGSKEKLRGKISAVLVKDFNKPIKETPKCFFNTEKYIEFNVEPNMVVDIPEGVNSLSSYLALFSKKYRNRAKAILKSSEAITVKLLSAAEIKQQQNEIYSLYEQVYNNAKFKLVKLPVDYFFDCKKVFGEKFIFNAFYLNNRLVAFSSGIDLNNSCYEAHYIGFDYAVNKDLELYQNILYQFLEKAIQLKKKRLNLGRTAAEIKSTIGARAQELTCYVKPQNTVSKVVLKPFISFLQPGTWIPRNPFKEEVGLTY